MILQIISGVLLLFAIAVIVFIKVAPQFGARSKNGRLDRIINSPNFKEGKFQNIVPTPMSGENTSMWKNGLKFMKKGNERQPNSVIETIKFDKEAFIKKTEGLSVAWFGHSSLILNVNGNIIITDPVFSQTASPVSFMGVKRFNYSNQFEVEDLPEIDVVLISHDHYDHLDYPTILKLKSKVKKFYVPLGVAAHLIRWGIDEEKIVELNWWDTSELNNSIQFIATPGRHFSGRKGVDKDSTLWCSWVIKSDNLSTFYCGDSGYGDHFKQIGEKFGPFDLTLMECGQYNEGWPYIHMMPEQSVQAHVDLKGKIMIPIHWGKFNLSLHKWTEPIERAKKEAEKLSVELLSPIPGAIVEIKTDSGNISDLKNEKEEMSEVVEMK